MELYYEFNNIDSDRYTIDGRLRQVLIGARELASAGLPADAQNWVNRHLKYTHGYGVSMSPTTEFSVGEGRPEFFIHDIPIKGSIPIMQPELYYGESSGRFVIATAGRKRLTRTLITLTMVGVAVFSLTRYHESSRMHGDSKTSTYC